MISVLLDIWQDCSILHCDRIDNAQARSKYSSQYGKDLTREEWDKLHNLARCTQTQEKHRESIHHNTFYSRTCY